MYYGEILLTNIIFGWNCSHTAFPSMFYTKIPFLCSQGLTTNDYFCGFQVLGGNLIPQLFPFFFNVSHALTISWAASIARDEWIVTYLRLLIKVHLMGKEPSEVNGVFLATESISCDKRYLETFIKRGKNQFRIHKFRRIDEICRLVL